VTCDELHAPDYQSRANARAKTSLLWGVLAFVCAQGALAYVVNRTHPELRDPEYGYRLNRLNEQAKAAPDRPLLLILGSSRTLSGIAPPCLSVSPAEVEVEPRVFNFSVLGAGPVRELLILRRLLAAGHRPKWLIVEVWPPFLPQQGYWTDEQHIMTKDLRWVDLPVVLRYFSHRKKALGKLADEGLVPIDGLRSNLLAHWAACLLSPDQSCREEHDRTLSKGNPTGWNPWLPHGTEEEFRARIQKVLAETKPLLDNFHVSETADRALRELLEECRRHNTKAALILMPEHSQLRSWYTPQVQQQLNSFLTRLKDEYRVPVIDARDWVPDDGFHDLTHMAPVSAPPFTQRLGREVILPWLTGRTLP
jgi:hypothetical protein